jgi:S1-C subfamily serine protease
MVPGLSDGNERPSGPEVAEGAEANGAGESPDPAEANGAGGPESPDPAESLAADDGPAVEAPAGSYEWPAGSASAWPQPAPLGSPDEAPQRPAYGPPPSEPSPYFRYGYGSNNYSQTNWSGAQWPPPPWSQQWTYGELPLEKAPRRPPRALPGWFGVALVAAVVGAIAGGGVVSLFASRTPQTIVREYFPSTPVKVQIGDIQSILASVLPAVVSIDTSSFRGTNGVGGFVQGAGTGMIITSGGIVVTNNHVIAGAQRVTVTLYGQTKAFPAKVIGTDATKDIALIQIEGPIVTPLPTVKFGNSNTAQQGDGVLAIGNALALAGGPTVTEGIVSAKDRSLSATTDDETTENLTGLIQTDAPINPGNSGGPLVNASGRVIAMNTAVATSSEGNAPAQNVGFAIAVDEIRTIVAQILHAAGSH